MSFKIKILTQLLLFCNLSLIGQNEALLERKQIIKNILTQEVPVLFLAGSAQKEIQEVFVKDEQVQRYFFTATGEPMFNEIFGIFPLRASEMTYKLPSCATGDCARVEMYNYAMNESVIGFINTKTKTVLSINAYKDVQPDIPPHLVDIANLIAKQNIDVLAELTKYNITADPLMSGTKTSLNRTQCQRSKHLCVAPTYTIGAKALWVIVDLTELKVAGMKWTNTGEGEYVTERSAQNGKVMDCFCDINNTLDLLGWSLEYSMTRSDGLKVSNINYEGKNIVKSIKVVDWHVSYSKVDGFGYSDAIGCPEYSTAAVHAIEAPKIDLIITNGDTIGFQIVQEYYSQDWPLPCNYNYYQRFEFYKDGSFMPLVGSIGRGCGTNGTYRPVTRISFGKDINTVEQSQSGNQWKKWDTEGWTQQSDTMTLAQDDAWFRLSSEQTKMTYHLVANNGQLDKDSHGDNAFLYVTKFHDNKDEGEFDLPAIGSCCNLDYKQGPEMFFEPIAESLNDTEVVLWYVPQLVNDNTPGKEYCWAEMKLIDGILMPVTFPCLSGPYFKNMTNE